MRELRERRARRKQPLHPQPKALKVLYIPLVLRLGDPIWPVIDRIAMRWQKYRGIAPSLCAGCDHLIAAGEPIVGVFVLFSANEDEIEHIGPLCQQCLALPDGGGARQNRGSQRLAPGRPP